MGSITLLVVPADEKDVDVLRAALAKKNTDRIPGLAPEQIDAQFQKLDKNKDGKLTKDEVPRLSVFFDRLDKDRDGALSKEEARAIGELLGGGGFGGQPGGGTGGDGNGGGKGNGGK